MNNTTFPSPFSLRDEIALITGGGTGLGSAIARCFVAAGAQVVLTGRRVEVLEKTAADLGSSAIALPADVNALDKLPALVKTIEEKVGPLTILVNNAGIHHKEQALDITDSEFSAILQTHVHAAFALTRESARGMLVRNKGNVIFISSMAWLLGIPQVAAYSAAKSAVIGLTKSLASEWSGQGVRVNAVVPGWIKTPMTAAALEHDPERKAEILSRTPMGCLGQPEDIGWATVYLSSPAAKFITGTTLVVDGGASIGF